MTRGFLASGTLLALLLMAVPALADETAPPTPSDTPSPSAITADQIDPTTDWVACACGCGVFDVGDVYDMVPTKATGGMVWFRYSYMNQDQNWEGSHAAPASDNQDKQIVTSFFTVGGQYTFNKTWTLMAELPLFDRRFTTTDDGTVQGPNGSIYTANLFALGDMKLMADYTGFSPDLTTGFEFGIKLPTGDSNSPLGILGGQEFDRDSLPGTGSTDLLVGAYHIGSLTSDHRMPYSLQASYSSAMFITNDYRPGNEFDCAAGLGYHLGPVIGKETTPWLSLIGSFRNHDTGSEADFLNSGYSRILLAPGLECRFTGFRVYGDVEFPIVQYTNAASSVLIEGTSGQLIARELYKLQVSHDF